METIAKQSVDSPDASKDKQDGKRYRIVLIHASAGVNWSGGSETFAIELTQRLSAYFDVTLLGGSPCSPFYSPAGGVPRTKARQTAYYPLIAPVLERVSTHPDILIEHLTSFLPCTVQLLRRPADLIIPCNDYGGLAVAACVRTLIGTPFLYTEHAGLLGGGRVLIRNLRFRPNHLVVFSSTMANFVRTVQPTQSTRIIHNGVDTDRFTPKGKRIDFGLPKPVILCVASLYRKAHKRAELAIRAVARLPQASLLLCGDGPDREYFQSLGETMLGADRFAIRTFPFSLMPDIYRSADAFTLPSSEEPCALAYLEAMASGLPVVATDDEMRRYTIGDGGILCEVTDLDRYAAAIADVLSQDWEDRARRNALRFSWDAIVLQYRDLILQTVQQSEKV